jgi:tetratricopeptide (TPR) repeat protein
MVAGRILCNEDLPSDGNLGKTSQTCNNIINIVVDTNVYMKCVEEMANIFYKQGYFCQAYNLYKQLLEKSIPLLGIANVEIFRIKENMAETLANLGRLDEALVRYTTISRKKIKFFGLNNNSTINTLKQRASIYNKKHKCNVTLQEINDQLRNQISGPDENHEEMLKTLYCKAAFLSNVGEYNKALDILQQILSKEDILGEENSIIIAALQQKALSLYGLNKLNESSVILDRVIKLKSRIQGEDNFDTLNTMYDKARNLFELNCFDEAIILLSDIIEKRIRLNCTYNMDTTIAMFMKGDALKEIKNYPSSFHMYEETYKLLKELLGAEDEYTLIIKFKLSIVLMKMDKLKEALIMTIDLLVESKRALGETHEVYIKTSQLKDIILENMNTFSLKH